MKRILFVCLGNICRSPIAEGVARDIASKNGLDLLVDSCGTSSFHAGEPPCQGSIEVARRHGVDISHLISRPICDSDRSFDFIIAMDSSNRRDVLNLGFDPSKLYKLGDFGEGQDVPDPYNFRSADDFEMVYSLMESLVVKMLFALVPLDRD